MSVYIYQCMYFLIICFFYFLRCRMSPCNCIVMRKKRTGPVTFLSLTTLFLSFSQINQTQLRPLLLLASALVPQTQLFLELSPKLVHWFAIQSIKVALTSSTKPNVTTNVGWKHMLNFSQVTVLSCYCNFSVVYYA